MNSAFRAVKGDDGVLAYSGSTFPLAKGKYREYNNILYRADETITGGTFNSGQWTAIGASTGSSVVTNLYLQSLTGSTSGTSITLGLSETGVAAATYNYSKITVDKRGRITTASSLTAISGFTGAAGLTGATSGAGAGKILTAGLANTTVTPGTYQKATLTVDQKGRITFASGNTLSGVNGIGITGNTFGLTSTGVAAGTYQLATITVDARGRISFASGNTGGGGGSTTPVGTNGSIQFKNGSAFSGTSSFRYHSVNKALTIGTRVGVTGETSVSIGTGNYAQNTYSVAIGESNVASGLGSFMIGRSNTTASSYATAFGTGNTINVSNNYAFAAGRSNSFSASSQASQAFGMGNTISSSYAMVMGHKNIASGLGSFAGGYNESASGNRPNIAGGKASFTFSYTDSGQGSGHGALAPYSSILGGMNNNIGASNTGAAIIGGNSIKLTSAGYSYHTAVSNLVINDTPVDGTSQDVLLWDSTTKKVMKASQSVLSTTYTKVAYVSKNGSNTTGQVGVTNKPYLTIQAAVNALSALSPSSTDRAIVHVMQGRYVEQVNLASFVDVNLNTAEVTTIRDNGSVVDCRVLGKAKIRDFNPTAASTIYLQCAELNNGTNYTILVQNGSLTPSNIYVEVDSITGSVGVVGATATIKSKTCNGLLTAFGTAKTTLFFDTEYMVGTTVHIFHNNNHADTTVYVKAKKIENTSTGTTTSGIIYFNNLFIGRMYVEADEIIGHQQNEVIDLTQLPANGLVTLKGKIISKASTGDYTCIVQSAGKLHLQAGTVLIPSGTAYSITSGIGQNVVALGPIFGKADKHPNITIQLGTFAFDATYIV